MCPHRRHSCRIVFFTAACLTLIFYAFHFFKIETRVFHPKSTSNLELLFSTSFLAPSFLSFATKTKQKMLAPLNSLRSDSTGAGLPPNITCTILHGTVIFSNSKMPRNYLSLIGTGKDAIHYALALFAFQKALLSYLVKRHTTIPLPTPYTSIHYFSRKRAP